MLVVERASLLGDNPKITSAAVQQGQYGGYVVNFELGDDDAKKWATVTGNNVGRQVAIILDNLILQYPVVKEKIPNGRSQITLAMHRSKNCGHSHLSLKREVLKFRLKFPKKIRLVPV